MVVQTILLSIIIWNTGPGWDEWGHLPSGLYTLQYGDFQPYCVNPPLTRLIAAVPVLLTGGGIDYQALPRVPGLRAEGFLGLTYIEQHGEQCFRFMSIARTAVIPISLLGTYLIWLIGGRLYGQFSAGVAASLWCLSPTVLAFGASITPDISAAVFGLLTGWRCYIWLRLPSFHHALLLGGSLALAMLSKSTWIILPALLIVISVLYAWRVGRRWVWRHRLPQVFAVAGSAWLLIHACYEFHGTLRPLKDFQFISGTLSGKEQDPDLYSPTTGNRFQGTWLAGVPAALPADYVQGIDIQKRDFEMGMDSYFLGQWRKHGWWYYYLVGILLKEPVALWLLAAMGWGSALWLGCGKLSRTKRTFRWVVMLPGVVALIFVSSQTGFNHHLRYVLPFFPCLYLLVAQPLSRLSGTVRFSCLLLLLWYGVSSVSVVPRSYGFFSEAVGGPEQGLRYMSDSNLDWGQDLLTAKRWIENNPERRPVYLVYSLPVVNFRKLGIDADDGRDWVTPDGPTKPGWWIVFSRPMLETPNRWFRDHDPDIQLSITTSIFEVNELPDDH